MIIMHDAFIRYTETVRKLLNIIFYINRLNFRVASLPLPLHKK